MKNILSLTILLSAATLSYAQQSASIVHHLDKTITETYQVQQNASQIREGSYTATYRQMVLPPELTNHKPVPGERITTTGPLEYTEIVVAQGNYMAGKRIGNWNFYNPNKKLIQSYNYDSSKITFADTTGPKHLKYQYIADIKPGDAVAKPIKIGGFSYSLVPIIYQAGLKNAVSADFPQATSASCSHILTVNAQGDLIKHEVQVTVKGGFTKLYAFDVSGYEAELCKFIPATVNNQPVECKVISMENLNLQAPVHYTVVTTEISPPVKF